MSAYFFAGMILGLSAGITPGPLMALMFSQTLQNGIGAGIRIALVPLVTATPVLAISLLFVGGLSNHHTSLGLVSIVGGSYVAFLGIKDLRFNGVSIGNGHASSRPMYSGIIVNLFSPYPYLFWFSVGAPLVIKAAQSAYLYAAAFIAGFFIFVVGAKMVLALLIARSRGIMKGNAYIYTIRILGLALLLLASRILHDGVMLILR